MGVFPLWSKAAEVELGGAGMTTATTTKPDGAWELDFGMQSFKIARFFYTIRRCFLFV
jgi:hypothetical protein